MKTLWIHIIFILTLGLAAHLANAQDATATARLDSTRMLIGSQSNLELVVTVPKGSMIHWPAFADTLSSHIEIVRKSGLDTVSSNAGQYSLRQVLRVTSFDSGYFAVPPIRFSYNFKGDTTNYFVETQPQYVAVNNIMTDQDKDIKPIKPPLTAPITLKEILLWVGLVLLLAAIAYGIYWYLKKRKHKEPVIRLRLKPTVPPDEAAIEALETLRLKKLWQSGRIKEYYSEMTDIVREYIELRFQVRALEMTTDEISSAIRQTEVNKNAQEKLVSTLALADLVKFAKEQPLPVENDLSLNNCMDFVRETRPARTSEPVTTAENIHNQEKTAS